MQQFASTSAGQGSKPGVIDEAVLVSLPFHDRMPDKEMPCARLLRPADSKDCNDNTEYVSTLRTALLSVAMSIMVSGRTSDIILPGELSGKLFEIALLLQHLIGPDGEILLQYEATAKADEVAQSIADEMQDYKRRNPAWHG